MFEYDRHSALVHHRLAMSMLAGRMHPNFGPALRHSDPIAYADLVASMNDHRAGLCIAYGVSLDDIDRNGFSAPGVMAGLPRPERLSRSAPAATPPAAHDKPRTGPRPVVDVHLPADEDPADSGLWTRSALLGGGSR